MATEKLRLWSKDEAVQFWDKNAKTSISWTEIDAKKEIFTCWICKKYTGATIKKNKVTEGCSV